MAKVKKFGTFGGVFTPSILTILGVIMYLRFPSIIGQAGLLYTIGIILIAHIISITTSLSVASLSTDKPVQIGGTYFMISRSLGLPIGGTLGLALFVGLSFSVSLYLIGFAESFLQYFDWDTSIQSIRIVGSIVLLTVTTITFISTSLAIKSQYFIMAAIGLSLLSIFFGSHELSPTTINWEPLKTSAPFMLLFGIFFPAVTGFEAGVSMSGDLKDPKRSLPVGAMMAVGVGFVVYVGLAFFFALTVDANALATDSQILFKISLFPQLVIAGIWGATLSSALGSILGAPRILQAIALDKIAPAFFGKGVGKMNEPRNALLLAFLIAEAGILIGELDVIARIVSMFFITTYAFLNLASAIESWSSSDFRPAFKIPRFVSILGTLSAFIVMILLDFLALAGAVIVLGLLYFYLQRKELILEGGDAWSSFWTNLAKRSLLKLSRKKTENRNWRPNIILFSGGEKARPYLVELGLALSGKLGALTDFKLITNDDPPLPKKITASLEENKYISHFTRELSCSTIKQGIKTVTDVYGFSGFEPNTVLMGWSRSIQNVEFLTEVMQDFKIKNLNAAFLIYHSELGFGAKQQIDIWWNGKGRLLSFALTLLRFLLSDPAWRDVQIRILIITIDSTINDSIYRNTQAVLDEMRMSATIKILNNDYGSRSKEEIILAESSSSDLTLLGLSETSYSISSENVESVRTLTGLNSSIVLLNPSHQFESINLIDIVSKKTAPIIIDSEAISIPPLPSFQNQKIKGRLELVDSDLQQLASDFLSKTFLDFIRILVDLQDRFKEQVELQKSTLEKIPKDANPIEVQKTITRSHQTFLRGVSRLTETQNTKLIEEAVSIFKYGLPSFLSELDGMVQKAPDDIVIPYVIRSGDKEKEKKFTLKYLKSFTYQAEHWVVPSLSNELEKWEIVSFEIFSELRRGLMEMNDIFEKLSILTTNPREAINMIDHLVGSLNESEIRIKRASLDSETTLLSAFRQIPIALAEDMTSIETIKKSNKRKFIENTDCREKIASFSDHYSATILLNNSLYLDALTLSQNLYARNLIKSVNEKIDNAVTESLMVPLDKLIENLDEAISGTLNRKRSITFIDQPISQHQINQWMEKFVEIKEGFPENLEVPETIYQGEKSLKLEEYQALSINVRKSASFYIDALFHDPYYRSLLAIEKQLSNAVKESKEAYNLLLFHLNNSEDNSNNFAEDMHSRSEIFENWKQQLEIEKASIQEALDKIQNQSHVYLNEAFSNLFFHAIHQSKDIGKIISSKERKSLIQGIVKKVNGIKTSMSNALIYLINSSTSGVLLSQKFLDKKESKYVQPNQIHRLLERLMPYPTAYQATPLFYRSLMSRSSKITEELWINRPTSYASFREASQRHQTGLGGAILIKGTRGAGKTALIQYAVKHLFHKHNVIHVEAPTCEEPNPNTLLQIFQKHISGFDNVKGLFNALPYGTVIVIDDLELWWERTPTGNSVIQQIINLTHYYGSKILFILGINEHAYHIINKINSLEGAIQTVIDCEPFKTQELQQLILSKHKTSGLKLEYNGVSEEAISQLTYSLLFNTYFFSTNGNPGIALNLWKANISKFENETLSIKKPNQIHAEFLHKLHPDWFTIIVLFIQHRNLNVERLARITGFDYNKSLHLLMTLKNVGIVVLKPNGVFALGNNIEPHLIDVCLSKGII